MRCLQLFYCRYFTRVIQVIIKVELHENHSLHDKFKATNDYRY